MSKTTKISVPKELETLTISFGGDDAKEYKINDGHVSVANEDVDKFLEAVPGSSVERSKPEAGTTGDGQ